jgi:hypothetical protein
MYLYFIDKFRTCAINVLQKTSLIRLHRLLTEIQAEELALPLQNTSVRCLYWLSAERFLWLNVVTNEIRADDCTAEKYCLKGVQNTLTIPQYPPCEMCPVDTHLWHRAIMNIIGV